MTTASTRTVLRIDLEPIAGSRFQPTGFPDLGAATFDSPAGESLVVESVQSMANRMEATTWDEAAQAPTPAVAALPYVRVVDPNGDFLTSSRVEAHRLNAAYITSGKVDGTLMLDVMRDRFKLVTGKPLNNRAVAQAVYELDPVSLVHGVFFPQQVWAWQPKIARAVTMFIDAVGVRAAVSGGVKKDSVFNTSKDAEGQSSKEGFGMVPHHRTEYTAERITAHAVIDHQQIRAYGLSPQATGLVEALAAYEVAAVLSTGLRLRTACDLVVVDADRHKLPDLGTASEALSAAIETARAELGSVTEVAWTSKSSGKAAKTPEND
jgi:CRISPR-associated protein Csb1